MSFDLLRTNFGRLLSLKGFTDSPLIFEFLSTEILTANNALSKFVLYEA